MASPEESEQLGTTERAQHRCGRGGERGGGEDASEANERTAAASCGPHFQFSQNKKKSLGDAEDISSLGKSRSAEATVRRRKREVRGGWSCRGSGPLPAPNR